MSEYGPLSETLPIKGRLARAYRQRASLGKDQAQWRKQMTAALASNDRSIMARLLTESANQRLFHGDRDCEAERLHGAVSPITGRLQIDPPFLTMGRHSVAIARRVRLLSTLRLP